MESGHITHIGRINFRNDERVFGIKHEDRFSHVYVIGKTGTGKSTLLETMALQDLERANGFALIDPREISLKLHRKRVLPIANPVRCKFQNLNFRRSPTKRGWLEHFLGAVNVSATQCSKSLECICSIYVDLQDVFLLHLQRGNERI